jgi:hypothetical protein
MSVALQHDSEVFAGGPPLKAQRYLGLIKPDQPMIARRAVLGILITWAPLALLSIGHAEGHSLFSDVAAYARFFLAVPLLIFAEADCSPKLNRIAQFFAEGGFIRESDRLRYDSAINSTRRLLESNSAELIAMVLTYAAALSLVRFVPLSEYPAWYQTGGSSSAISPAGWWQALVSVPIMLLLVMGWLWRILLWWRFLWLMASLDLHMVPSHPDHAGGVHFVSKSLRSFRALGLAFGAIFAGPIGNRVIHQGAPLLEFKSGVITFVAMVLILLAGPLLVFRKKLLDTKGRGVYDYGMLASDVGRQFEDRWLKRTTTTDEDALKVGDFSATTDLYQVTDNVYGMKYIPLGLHDLGFLTAAVMLPFLPIIVLSVPLADILAFASKLLL